MIPIGRYRTFEGRTFFKPRSMADKILLEKALHAAKKAARGEISKERAKEIAPEMSKLWDLMPKTRDQAYQF